MADSIECDRWVHTFGCGHATLPIEEMYPRIGGFVGFHPLIEQPLTFFTRITGESGIQQFLFLERAEGYGNAIMSSWNFDAKYQFSYKGNGIYQAKITGPVDMSDAAQTYNGFKVADDSDNWTTQFIAASSGKVIKPLELDTNYELFGHAAGTEDLQKNTLNLGAGEFIFQVKFDSTPTATPATVGTMKVCQLVQ